MGKRRAQGTQLNILNTALFYETVFNVLNMFSTLKPGMEVAPLKKLTQATTRMAAAAD